MKYTVYLDVLFLINFGMDIFLIWLTGFVCRQKAVWWRYLLGAFAGSLLLVLLVWLPFPAAWAYYLCGYGVVGILMCCLAFWPRGIKNILKCYASQLMITFLLGGIMNWLYFSSPVGEWLNRQFDGGRLRVGELLLLVLFGGGVLLILTTGFGQYRKQQKQELYRISLYFDDRQNVYGMGYLDTGNFLTEPATGRPVVVAEAGWIQEILPEDYRKLLHTYLAQGRIDYDWIAEKHLVKAKWIPYQAVGQPRGELLGFQCRKLILRLQDKCVVREHVIVGISRTPITDGRRYQMLLHKDIIEEEYICCR